MRFRLENRSGYETRDLHRFVEKALRNLVPRTHPLQRKRIDVVFVASPIRSRGCAEVGGHRIVIAIASPSRFSLRRLARLFEHETAHLAGFEHEVMPHALLYCLGPVPVWARGLRFRYRSRATDQIAILRRKTP